MTKRIGMKPCGCTFCRCDKKISNRSTRTPVCDFCFNSIHKGGK